MNTTDTDTQRFLEGLWYRWGETLVQRACEIYQLDPLQREAVENILLRPNDWIVRVKEPLSETEPKPSVG